MSARRVFVAILLFGMAGSGRAERLTLLHTNDIHGHLSGWRGWEGEFMGKTIGGFDRIAMVVKEVRATSANVLLLDAGDTMGDTMIASVTKGRAILAAMNAVGYDAMAVGNHEPDFTIEGLHALIREATFPVLAANIVERESGEFFTKPYIIREIAGTKVGVLGLTYPQTALTTAKKNVANVEFGDPIAAAQRFLPKIQQEGAQLIIALTHLGLDSDKQLAAQVPGIAVIVGGHSHNRMSEALRVGETLIVQAGAHGSDVGRLDLELKDGRITAHTRTLLTLDHATVPVDAETATLIAALEEPYRRQLDEEVGEASDVIPRAQTIAGQEARKRDQPSPADVLFAQIMREETGSEIALLPGVGYGVALQRGPISAAALRNLIPHDGKVVTMLLAGAQIHEIIEQSLTNTYSDDPETKVGGLIQVAGLQFRHDGKRLIEVTVGNRPLNPTRDYRVVTNSMLAGGGHNYRTFEPRARAGGAR